MNSKAAGPTGTLERPGVRICRHLGASFEPGEDLLHVWWTEGRVERVCRAWDRFLVRRGLAAPLEVQSEADGHHGWAPGYPFLPLRLVRSVVEVGHGAASAPSLEDDLTVLAFDAAAFGAAFALHRQEALARGWPAWPVLFGPMPGVIVGCGRRHRAVSMNLAPSTSPLAALGGWNKAVGRDLLRAYGIPVAPGGMARSPGEAVARAEELGWPVVLKRPVGGNSDGIITDVHDTRSCAEGARALMQGDHAVLVERQVSGLELRVHVVGGAVREVHRRGRVVVRADGRSSLREMAEAQYGTLFRMARRSAWARKKLVFRFWAHGARRYLDLERIVPRRGAAVLLGLSFLAPERGRGLRDLHPTDRRKLEEFLRAHGSPSGALDLMLPRAGARLSEGGAVLEMNIPSGFWYLQDREGVVREELDLWADKARASRGPSVPVWLAATPRASSRPPHRLMQRFRSVYPGGRVAGLEGADPWPAVLTQDAEALLIPLSEHEVEAHGLPMNLAPEVWHAHRSRAAFRSAFPLLVRTLEHAGEGVRIRTLPPGG